MSAAPTPTLLPSAVGWYGKLADRGDFDGRGVPAQWLGPWDDWLQRALAAASQLIGPRLLRERLLAMAPWQFLVSQPGRSDWSLACGLVVASSDRVGRVFPFLVVEALGSCDLDRLTAAVLHERARALAAWLQPALARSRAAVEDGARGWATTPWPAPEERGAGTSGTSAVAPLPQMAASDAARSSWWRRLADDQDLAAIEQPWPPADALLLEWLAVSD